MQCYNFCPSFVKDVDHMTEDTVAVSVILTVACFGRHPKQVPVAVPTILTVAASARDDRADEGMPLKRIKTVL